MTQGTQQGTGDSPLQGVTTTTVPFERSKSLDLTFAPGVTTVIDLKLATKGVPYWSRPDLGIDPEDVKVEGGKMTVTVHSVGAVDSPASKLVVRSSDGKTIATGHIPALKAPADLTPKTAAVKLAVPAGGSLKGATITIECGGKTGDHADE